MKTQRYIHKWILLLVVLNDSADAATIVNGLPGPIEVRQSPGLIQVCGVINGGLVSPNNTGDTLDYLKFEVLTPSTITASMIFYSSNRHLLAAFIGQSDSFGFIEAPNALWITPLDDPNAPLPSFSRSLPAGIYIIASGQDNHTSYDVYDGFQAVNPEGGGFISAPYAYEISGDVRALEFWDGNLDGTFTIMLLPEPGSVLLLLVLSATRLLRRARPTQ